MAHGLVTDTVKQVAEDVGQAEGVGVMSRKPGQVKYAEIGHTKGCLWFNFKVGRCGNEDISNMEVAVFHAALLEFMQKAQHGVHKCFDKGDGDGVWARTAEVLTEGHTVDVRVKEDRAGCGFVGEGPEMGLDTADNRGMS